MHKTLMDSSKIVANQVYQRFLSCS